MENSYPQRMAGIGSRILMFCTMIHLWGAPNSPSAADALSTTGSVESWGPRGRAAWKAAWTCCRAFSCSRPQSNQQTFRSLNKAIRREGPDEVYVASKIQRVPLEPVFLSYRSEVTDEATWPLPWKEYFNMSPNSWTPRIFTEADGLWILVEFISTLWHARVLPVYPIH